jgi:hypothetical protein
LGNLSFLHPDAYLIILYSSVKLGLNQLYLDLFVLCEITFKVSILKIYMYRVILL